MQLGKKSAAEMENEEFQSEEGEMFMDSVPSTNETSGTYKFPFWAKMRSALSEIPILRSLYWKLSLITHPSFCEDGMATMHGVEFMKDPKYMAAYKAALRHQNHTEYHWRIHTILWSASQALKHNGDFVECGVNRGFMSRAVIDYIDFGKQTKRTFYLFDTFNGPVSSLISKDDLAAHRNTYNECFEFVKNVFKDVPNVRIVRGAVPNSLSTVNISKVSYLSIDMNCAIPEAAALAHFWPKLVSGGIIILDDYAFVGYESQRIMADSFAQSVGVKVLTLPTGQGMLVKP